jgi:hypothetical protein
MSKRDEVQAEIDNLHRNYSGHRRTISLQLEGPAIIYASMNKKRAGYPGSRGSYVSRAIIYWEEQGPEAIFGEVSDLRREVNMLRKNIGGLQNVIRKLNSEIGENIDNQEQ